MKTHLKNNILIKKASGERVPFSKDKIRLSLQKSGASEPTIDKVLKDLANSLYPDITTKELFRRAYRLLRQYSKHQAARYKLKQAIMELGPSGFSFEKYIAEILRAQGYTVKVGEIVVGKCVSHEIDIIALKEKEQFMIECKYHNHPGTKSDIKIPLYIHARFKDVEEKAGPQAKFGQGWVITNTKFTEDAIRYGTCAGLHLIGWDYPSQGSLRETIDKLALYPITCLTSLTKSEKRLLLEQRIVLCKEIQHDEAILSNLGLSASRIKAVVVEALELCQTQKRKGQNKKIVFNRENE